MKRSSKRIMAYFLAVAVICTFNIPTTFAYASEPSGSDLDHIITDNVLNEIESIDAIDYEGIQETTDILDSFGSYIMDVKVEDEGVIIETEIKGIDEVVVVNEAQEEGDIDLDIYEEDKHDRVVLTDTGEVYLNGKLVESYIEENMVTADWQQYCSSPPYGSSSDYTYARSNKNVDKTYYVQCAKLICKHTVAGLCFAIGTLLGGVGAGFLSAQASAIISKAVDGDGKTVKITAKIYYHKNKKKFMIDNARGCQKEALKFYAKKTDKYFTTGKWWLYNVVNGA